MRILRTRTRGPRRRESATRSPHPDTIRTWFDVRVGRLADRLVADFSPSGDGDLLLERLAKRYAGQVKLTHMLVVFELNAGRDGSLRDGARRHRGAGARDRSDRADVHSSATSWYLPPGHRLRVVEAS